MKKREQKEREKREQFWKWEEEKQAQILLKKRQKEERERRIKWPTKIQGPTIFDKGAVPPVKAPPKSKYSGKKRGKNWLRVRIIYNKESAYLEEV